MTNYRNGTALEHRAMRLLVATGHDVIRAGGSRGTADVWAAHPAHPLTLVQAKTDRHAITLQDQNALWFAADYLGATPVIVDMSGPRRTPRWWRVTRMRGHRERIDDTLTSWDPTTHHDQTPTPEMAGN